MTSIRSALTAAAVPFEDREIPGAPKPFAPIGVMVHHTVSGRRSGNLPTLGLILNGRGGDQPLPPPVVQILIGRDGTVVLCSEGHSYHAGKGERRALNVAQGGPGVHRRASTLGDVNGNPSFIGIEVENDGQGEPYDLDCWNSIVAVCAALCSEFGWNPIQQVLGHKEWTSGKIDPLYDMDLLRGAVGIRMAAPQEDEMTDEQMRELMAYIDSATGPDSFLSRRIGAAWDDIKAVVGARVDDVGKAGRVHAKTMADSIKADLRTEGTSIRKHAKTMADSIKATIVKEMSK